MTVRGELEYIIVLDEQLTNSFIEFGHRRHGKVIKTFKPCTSKRSSNEASHMREETITFHQQRMAAIGI
jgi:hypothetical protein